MKTSALARGNTLVVRRRIRPAAFAVPSVFLLLVSCVEVQTFYRDAPPLAMDVPARDVPRMDTPGLDVPEVDADSMTGAAATRAVLASIGERVIYADIVAFHERAQALETATASAMGGGATELEAARLAWRDAIAVFQRIEVLQLGPAGLVTLTTGGLGLRDVINGWPLITTCRIDSNLVDPVYDDRIAIEAGPINARGLTALEYVLFIEGAENGCPASSRINTDGSWAALGAAEVSRRRGVYAHHLASLILEHAVELRQAWDPAGGNFLGALSTAGAGSAVYPSAQLGLNAISDALVYLYKEVVDYKVGIPAGIGIECPTDACPEQVESRWAHASIHHLRANLGAFRDTYLGAPEGSDAPGFDDLVRSVGGTELDARIHDLIAQCFAALDAIDGTLEEAVVSEVDDVAEVARLLRALADAFRVEVVSLLDLAPAMRVEGDND
jgi:predicted lipoprotein